MKKINVILGGICVSIILSMAILLTQLFDVQWRFARAAVLISNGPTGTEVSTTENFLVNISANSQIDDASLVDWKTRESGLESVNYTLNDIEAISENTAYVVGNNGRIFKTSNGGTTWDSKESGTDLPLEAVSFSGEDYGLIALSGKILKTETGGNVWYNALTGTSTEFNGVFLLTPSIGWAVGSEGVIIKTTDGGVTWTTQNSGTSEPLYDIFFLDGNTGWAGGENNTLLKTTDGGATWLSLGTGFVGASAINGIQFINANEGWAAGAGTNGGRILHTTNGGDTWTEQESSSDYKDVYFFNANSGWAARSNALMYTSDSGATWTASLNDGSPWTNEEIKAMDMDQSSGVGWAVTSNGQILKKSSAEVTTHSWESFNSPLPAEILYNVQFTSGSTTGFAMGDDGRVLKTQDSGATWTAQNGITRPINDFQFINGNTGYAAGEGGTVFKTTDGGTTWQQFIIGEGTDVFRGLYAVDANTVYAVGNQGVIIKTTDGSNWNYLRNGIENWTTQQLNEVFCTDASTCFAAAGGGSGGNVWYTDDGGATWSVPVNLGAGNLNDIYFADSNTGWTVGWGGQLYATTNGGATWASQNSGVSDTLYDIYAIGTSTAWAVGTGGVILSTTDGGATWNQQPNPTFYPLNSIYFADGNYGWAVGQSGIIVATENGGATWTLVQRGVGGNFYDIYADNSGAPIWLVGANGDILYSADGQNVEFQTNNGLNYTPNNLSGVYAIGSTTAYIVGGNQIFKTVNAGTTWTELKNGDNQWTAQSLDEISFSDENTGWAVGDAGTILHTSDGGTNWAAQVSGTIENLNALVRVGSTSGTLIWAVGGNGTILHTVDGGTNWAAQTSGTTTELYSVYFADEFTGWAVGDSGTVLKTVDGGENWTAQNSGGRMSSLLAVVAADANTAAIFGSGGFIARTTDGGDIWTVDQNGGQNWTNENINAATVTLDGTSMVTTDVGGFMWLVTETATGTTWPSQRDPQAAVGNRHLNDVFMLSGATAAAVGDQGLIILTEDGDNWNAVNSGTTTDLNALWFIDSATAFAVGSSGAMLKTTDAGITWTAQTSGGANWTTENLNEIFFSGLTGFAVGDNGTIIKTTDSGDTWTGVGQIPWPFGIDPQNLNDLFMFDGNTVVIVADGGYIFRTTDGGNNWEVVQNNGSNFTNKNLYGVHFYDASHGYAVGANGTILYNGNADAAGSGIWVAQNSQTTSDLTSVYSTAAIFAVAVGTNRSMFTTLDGGNNWSSSVNPNGNYNKVVLDANDTSGFAVGEDGLLARYLPPVMLQANTDNAAAGSPTGPNLCYPVGLSQDLTQLVCPHPALHTGTYYTLTIRNTSYGVRSWTGEELPGTYATSFMTGESGGGGGGDQGGLVDILPYVTFTAPSPGGSIPINGSVSFSFSQSMQSGTSSGSVSDPDNMQLYELNDFEITGENLMELIPAEGWGPASFALPADYITVGKYYRFIIKGDNDGYPMNGSCGEEGEPACVLSAGSYTGQWPLAEDYIVDFLVTETDNTPPSLEASYPAEDATNIDRAINDIAVNFNETIFANLIFTYPLGSEIPNGATNVILVKDSNDNGQADIGIPETYFDLVTDLGEDAVVGSGTSKVDFDGRTVHFSPNTVLDANSRYFLVLQGGSEINTGSLKFPISDAVGNTVSGNTVVSFTTGNTVNGEVGADTTPPTLLYANADTTSISLTFSEAMPWDAAGQMTGNYNYNPTHVNNDLNWLLEFSQDNGGSWQEWGSGVAIGTYDPAYNTFNIFLDNRIEEGTLFRVTASTNITDLSGNNIQSGEGATVYGTLRGLSETGGNVGPTGGGQHDFAGEFFTPTDVYPYVNIAGKTSSYWISFRTASGVEQNGTIRLTFPSGFSFDAATCNTWSSENDYNEEFGVNSISCDPVSRTINMQLADTIDMDSNVWFVVDGVVNGMEKDYSTPGYTMDIKTFNSSNLLLDSKTSAPFFITSGGARSISGKVFIDNGNGGGTGNDNVPNGGEAGVAGISVCLMGPTGRECKDTDGLGDYSFTSLPPGYYNLNLPPLDTGNYVVANAWRDIFIPDDENVTDAHFTLETVAASYLLDVAISGGVALANKNLDVFAWQTAADFEHSFDGGGGWVTRSVTLNVAGVATTQLPLTRGKWEVGVGPAMSKNTGSAKTMPVFDFIIPQPVAVEVDEDGVEDACTSGAQAATAEACFTLQAATSQIKGKITSGTGEESLRNVFVWARPEREEEDGFGGGGGAQTDKFGIFTLNVVPGDYIIEANMPGMSSAEPIRCRVEANNPANADNNATADVYCSKITGESIIANDGTNFYTASALVDDGTIGDNDLYIVMLKPDTTISGMVLDEDGNPMSYVPVTAMEVDASGGFKGGWTDIGTDSNGSYTVYVNGGSQASPKKWKIQAYAPSACGAMPSVTVSLVSGQNTTGKNIQASAGNCVSVSGRAYVDSNSSSSYSTGEEVAGAFISIFNSTTGDSNYTTSDDNGNYNITVPAGTGYEIEAHAFGQGSFVPLSGQDISVARTNKDLVMTKPGTIVAYVCTLSDPNASPSATNGCGSNTIADAFAEAYNEQSTNGVGVDSSGVYTVNVPAGTYSFVAKNAAIGEIGLEENVEVLAGMTTYINIAPPSLFTVSGTVEANAGPGDDSCLRDVTVFLNDNTQGRSLQTNTNILGVYSFTNVPSGTYGLSAAKPGCFESEDSQTIEVTEDVDVEEAEPIRLESGNGFILGRVWVDNNNNGTFDTGENVSFESVVVAASSSSGQKVIVKATNSRAATNNHNYEMELHPGTWTVQAKADGYASANLTVEMTEPAVITDQNLKLVPVAGYIRKEPKSVTVSPSAGGIVKNPSIDAKFQVNLTPGSLGSGASGSVVTNETTGVTDTNLYDVVGDKGVEVTPKNSAGQPITTVSSSGGNVPTITIPCTSASACNSGNATIGVWNTTKNQWESLPTTFNSRDNTLTAKIPHFSTFAIIVPQGGGAQQQQQQQQQQQTSAPVITGSPVTPAPWRYVAVEPEPAPPKLRLVVNRGALSTSNPIVRLRMRAKDDSAKMEISNYRDFRSVEKEDFRNTKRWNLCSRTGDVNDTSRSCRNNRRYRVYVRFYNEQDQVTETVSDIIRYRRLRRR